MSTTNKDRYFAQVPMPEWMFEAWGELAQDLEVEKQFIIEQSLKTFLESSDGYESGNDERKIPRYLILYASPPGSKSRSMWLNPDMYTQIDEFCKATGNRINRVVFSALLDRLLQDKKVSI